MSSSSSFILNNPYDFLTRFLPGAFFVGSIAVASLSVPVIQTSVLAFITAKPLFSTFLYSLISLFLGMVFEDLGSSIEAHWLDERKIKPEEENENLEKNKNPRKTVWVQYLQQEIDGSPVGHRYLRTLVVRLKFMLGVFVASFFTILSFYFITIASYYLNYEFDSIFLPVCFLFNLLLFWLSCWSICDLSDLLHDTRKIVLEGLKKS